MNMNEAAEPENDSSSSSFSEVQKILDDEFSCQSDPKSEHSASSVNSSDLISSCVQPGKPKSHLTNFSIFTAEESSGSEPDQMLSSSHENSSSMDACVADSTGCVSQGRSSKRRVELGDGDHTWHKRRSCVDEPESFLNRFSESSDTTASPGLLGGMDPDCDPDNLCHAAESQLSLSMIKGEPDVMEGAAAGESEAASRTVCFLCVPEELFDDLELYVENQKRGGGEFEHFLRDVESRKATVTFVSARVAEFFLKQEVIEVQGHRLQVIRPMPPKVSDPVLATTNQVDAMDTGSSVDEGALAIRMDTVEAVENIGSSAVMIPETVNIADIESPPPMSTVEVSWTNKTLNESTLKMYFSNRKRSGGGPVSDIHCFAEEGKALIKFSDPDAAQRVVAQSVHKLLGDSLHVSLVTGQKRVTAELDLIDDNTSYSCAIEVSDIPSSASKDVISMFFENRKRSGGGTVEEIVYNIDEQRAVITFQNPDVVDSVIQKHSINPLYLCNSRLNIVPLYPKADSLVPFTGDADPRRLLICSLPDSLCMDDLRRYFQKLSNPEEGNGMTISKVMYSIHPGIALVEFSVPYDYCAIRQLTRLKPFNGVMINVQRVAHTDSLQISDVGNLAPDHIVLYFESLDGVDVLDVKEDKDDKISIVQFADRNVLPELLRRSHVVESHALRVTPYFDCLGPVLTDAGDEPKWTPSDLIMTFSPKIVQFASSCSSFSSHIESELRTISPGCTVVWPESSKSEDLSTVRVQFARAAKVASVKYCEGRMKELLGLIEYEDVSVLQEIWGDFVNRVNEKLNRCCEVAIELDETHSTVSVVGLKEQFKEFVTKLHEIRATLEAELQLQKTRITDRLSITKPIQVHFLQQSGLLDSSLGGNVTIEVRGNEILLSGLPADIIQRKVDIYQAIADAVQEKIRIDDFVLELMKKPAFCDHINACFQQKSLEKVVWEKGTTGTDVVVCGATRPQVDAAISIFRTAFLCKDVELDDADFSAFKLPGWNDLKGSLTSEYQTLELVEGDHLLTLKCSSNIADVVLERIQNFIRENAIREEFISAANTGIVSVVERYLCSEVKAICTDFVHCAVTVRASTIGSIPGPGFVVSGTIHGQKHAAQRLRALMAKVVEREKVLDQPGIAQFLLESRGRKAVAAIENRHKAFVCEIKDDDTRRQVRSSSDNGPVINLEITVRKKFVLKVVMGDITEYKVDAIVNAANTSLDHAGGVARSIVDKGGIEIQEECNSFIRTNGLLLPAQLYISKPGNLPCKAVIHAVGPIWMNGSKNEQNILYETVTNILEEAKKCKFHSIALPAISTGLYRFPLSKASLAIIEAVRDFAQRGGTKSFTEVHFIDQSQKVVSQFTDTAVSLFKDVNGAQVVHVVQNDDANGAEVVQRRLGPRTRSYDLTKGKRASRENRMSLDMDDLMSVYSTSTSSVGPSPTVSGGVLQTPEGLTIKLVKGSLVQQQVDIIVNTTARDLNLANGAVSRLILNTAGPQIQAECQQNAPGGVQFGGVVETSAYSLPCTKVYHGACQAWDNGVGGCEKTFRAFMREIFSRADMSGSAQSIAIPAIGTGNLKIPHALVAQWMYEEAENFSQKSPGTQLRDVRFVVYDKDSPTIAAFEAELINRAGTTAPKKRGQYRSLVRKNSGIMDVDEEPQSMKRISGQWTIKLGTVTLSVKHGDITRESTDAIVNSSNINLRLEQGAVSKSIMIAAGPDLVEECKRFVERGKWDRNVAVTSAGNLPSRKIFHIAAEHGLSQGIKTCLEKANEMGLSSITFPLLGTGNQRNSASHMASMMLDTVEKFINKQPDTSLALIQIVIFESAMFDDFAKALTERTGSKSVGLLTKAKQFLGFSSSDHQFDVIEEPELPSLHSFQEPEKPVNMHRTVRLRVSALSPTDIDLVVHELDDLCSENVREHVLDASKHGEIIAKLTDEQIARIQAIDNEFPVKIEINPRLKDIRIRGLSESIASVLEAIYEIFREVESEERNKVEAELITKQVKWMYQAGTGSGYEEYPPEINGMIEKAYQNKAQKATWDEEDGKYELDFLRMIEEKVGEVGNTVKVKRISSEAAQLPKSWDPMVLTESFKQVTLPATSQEYKDVETNVMASAGTTVHQIVNILRIQNPSLYQQYIVRKDSMERTQQNANVQAERILWHGTSSDTLESINLTGFNRSYCGKNAVAYGRGVYFAQQFSYSAGNTYAAPDVNGNKHVYQSRVLTGEFTTGHQSYVVPPQKPGTSGAANRFDSVVDNVNAPAVFVIFSDTQAYPEYLVIFK